MWMRKMDTHIFIHLNGGISISWVMIQHSKIKILPFSVFVWDLFLLRKQISAT